MKITFSVNQLPPKKDGANSMWCKGSEQTRLRALRSAAFEAMRGQPLISSLATLTIRIFADIRKGDLDNFITGICDGLMAAHPLTPIDPATWQDIPDEIRPGHPICYIDDAVIQKIFAERLTPMNNREYYVVELDWQ